MKFKTDFLNLKKKAYSTSDYLKFCLYRSIVNKVMSVDKNILIFGNSRGGTTILAELFLNRNRAVIWEPLMPNALKYYNADFVGNLGNIPYIAPEVFWSDANDFFTKLFGGIYLSSAMFKYNLKDNDYWNPNQVIMKFCRGNALLPWLCNNFDIKPIYLIRHPLAVVSSQLQHMNFRGYKVHADTMSYQNGKYLKLFEMYRDQIRNIRSIEEMFAVWWCLSNAGPLIINEANRKWITVSYEMLIKQPEFEYERVTSHTGNSFSSDYLLKLKRPSASSIAGFKDFEKGNQLSVWRNHLSRGQIKLILNKVYQFGFTMYSDKSEPDYTKLGY
jgi:hypothetical protein